MTEAPGEVFCTDSCWIERLSQALEGKEEERKTGQVPGVATEGFQRVLRGFLMMVNLKVF